MQEQSFLFCNNTQETKLDKLIRNAHYDTKEAKLLMDFVWLIELDKAKKVWHKPKWQQYFCFKRISLVHFGLWKTEHQRKKC